MKEIIDIDYINVRDAHVHGIINPTFIMYGNCDLEKYDFEVEVEEVKIDDTYTEWEISPVIIAGGIFCLE